METRIDIRLMASDIVHMRSDIRSVPSEKITLLKKKTRACDHFGLIENWSAKKLWQELAPHKEPHERSVPI